MKLSRRTYITVLAPATVKSISIESTKPGYVTIDVTCVNCENNPVAAEDVTSAVIHLPRDIAILLRDNLNQYLDA